VGVLTAWLPVFAFIDLSRSHTGSVGSGRGDGIAGCALLLSEHCKVGRNLVGAGYEEGGKWGEEEETREQPGPLKYIKTFGLFGHPK